jgi:hypothetical protein
MTTTTAVVCAFATIATAAATHAVATITMTTATTASRGTTAIGRAMASTTAATVTSHCRLFAAQQGNTDNREKDRDAQN